MINFFNSLWVLFISVSLIKVPRSLSLSLSLNLNLTQTRTLTPNPNLSASPQALVFSLYDPVKELLYMPTSEDVKVNFYFIPDPDRS